MKPADAHLKNRCRRILLLLERTYGRAARPTREDPVASLVGTILSQNTSGANSGEGFRRLTSRFPDWDAVADAPLRRIERCISVCGLGRLKAPRIREAMRLIRAERGRIDLGFLKCLPAAEAYDYLVRFDGVGPKTALCVMLFGLGMDVFPVDTHVFRVSRRLGLLPDGVPAARAHEALTPLIPPGRRYAMHVLLIRHGQVLCRPRRPRCRHCCLLRLCPAGTKA